MASNNQRVLLIAAALTVSPALGLRDAVGQEPAYPVKARVIKAANIHVE